MRLTYIALLCALFAPLAASAQSSDYLGLEELGDVTQEARQIQVFEAKAGQSLRQVLKVWSAKAGWSAPKLDLPAEMDFVGATTLRFEGDYKTATRSLVRAMGSEANLQVAFEDVGRRAVLSMRAAPAR